jgi:hypothetical protein
VFHSSLVLHCYYSPPNFKTHVFYVFCCFHALLILSALFFKSFY